MDICPEYANLEKDGELVQTDPDDVEIGDIIVIKPGERVPLDGTVISGESMVDTSALTGESVPVEKQSEAPGSSARAGDNKAKEIPLGDRKNMVYMGGTDM